MLNRKRNTRRSAPRGWRLRLPAWDWSRIGTVLGSLAVIALALFALGWLLNQPIQRVIVTGRLQRVSALEVERVVRAHLAGAGLFHCAQAVDRAVAADGIRDHGNGTIRTFARDGDALAHNRGVEPRVA